MMKGELKALKYAPCLNCLPASVNHSMAEYEEDGRQLVQFRQTSKRHYAVALSMIRSEGMLAVTHPR
jgi:hypothetical protein